MAHAPETSRSRDTPDMRAEGEIAAAEAQLEGAAAVAARLAANIELVLHGKHEEIKLVLAALACHGHVLFEDVPGTGQDGARARDRASRSRARSSRASSARPTCSRPT